jgi:hypothetical protein
LKEVYNAGVNSPGVDYPLTYPYTVPSKYKNNELSQQLKIIARLLDGGIKTKLFLVRIDGFDTHAEQVLQSDPTQGIHAALLYHLTTAVEAFFKDLNALGLEDRVIAFTVSEFGRRAYSNASLGTDHGKAAPVFLFGNGLKGGFLGNIPDLNLLDDGNLIHEFDYRQIYTSLLMDWLGADMQAIQASKFESFTDTRLDLIRSPFQIGENHTSFPGKADLLCYPNPVRDDMYVKFSLQYRQFIRINLYDIKGRQIRNLLSAAMEPGTHKVEVSVAGLPRGPFMLVLEGENVRQSCRMIKQ